MKHSVYLWNLGRMPYMKTWELQKQIASEIMINVKCGREPKHKLLIVEHDPVYTVGIRKNNYKSDREKLINLGAEFHETNRGGLITFHGPGQLVAYPILHLPSLGQGIRWYVSALEKAVIKCCLDLGIHASTTKDTGIWIEDRKICAIGIQGRRVTNHGLALNCNTNLYWFDHIVPCGILGKTVTSVSKELNTEMGIPQVLPIFLNSFSETFDAKLQEE